MGIFPPSSPQLACGQPSLWPGQTKDKGEVQGIDGFLLSSHGHTSSTAGTHGAKSYLRRDVAHHRSPWPPPCLQVVLAPSTHRWLRTTIPSPRSLGWAGLRWTRFQSGGSTSTLATRCSEPKVHETSHYPVSVRQQEKRTYLVGHRMPMLGFLHIFH